MATSEREWQRVADGLRSFKEKQRERWGGVDEWLMARYISGNCTSEEKQKVEAARREYPHLDESLEVVARVMRLRVPPIRDATVKTRVEIGSYVIIPAKTEQVAADARAAETVSRERSTTGVA